MARDHLFKKGQSGNPNGRPKGPVSAGALRAKELIEEKAEWLVNKCFELAETGDVGAIRLCLERLLPPMKDWPKDDSGKLIPLILAINHVAEAVSDKEDE